MLGLPRTSAFSLPALALLATVTIGCGEASGGFRFDADVPDGSMPPPFRPPRCDDAGCLEGGVPEVDAGFDAGPPPPPCNELTFTYRGSAANVWISGTWLADGDGVWPTSPEEGALVLEDQGDGTFAATTLVEPIEQHLYKMIIDGVWQPDPSSDARQWDGISPMDDPNGYNTILDVCSAACGDLEDFDWRDTVMYFAMVDRFKDSDGRADPVPGASDDGTTSGQYEGGDLPGLEEELPYLSDLGVTALWLSAPYENRNTSGAAIDPGADPHHYSAYHGYWPSPENIDFSDPSAPSPRPAVESRIGTDADLRSLIAAAHGSESANGDGIKVLFDYVMNHVDSESGLYRAHPEYFAGAGGRPRLCGPENLWDDPYWGTRCAFTEYLPAFDFDNAEARRWSIDDALWWATEYGIDGYRLDAIKHVSLTWLTDLRSRLNTAFPEPAGDRFYLVGETFAYDDRELLARFVEPETHLDGQFDFPFKARLCEAVFQEGGNLDAFQRWMNENDNFYGPGALMTTWIGNHDIPRAIHFASRQIGDCRAGSHPGNGWIPASFPQPTDAAPYERLGVAFAIMMTNPGIPLIYYGDEIGLAGGGDPDNRRPMIWNEAELLGPQQELRRNVRSLSRARAEHPVLARGRRMTLHADANTWLYRRTGCGEESVLVAINKSDGPANVTLPTGRYEDIEDGSMVDGGVLSLGPRSFRLLLATP